MTENARIVVCNCCVEKVEKNPDFIKSYSTGNRCYFELSGTELTRLNYLADMRNTNQEKALRMAILNDFFLKVQNLDGTSFYTVDRLCNISPVIFN